MGNFKVPIKNVLYMYSYVWDLIDGTKELEKYKFNDNIKSTNFYAEIFLLNINEIVQKGLYKEYITKNEEILGIKGKIDFTNSISKLSFQNGKAYCEYDEMIENNVLNQIIKSTIINLMKARDILPNLKKTLNKYLLFFNQVDYIEIKKEDFKKINYNRTNKHYKYIIKICELINESKTLNDEKGNYEFYNIFEDDEKLIIVYEKFINRFYKEHLQRKRINEYEVKYQEVIHWNVEEENDNLLPIMKIDTTIYSKLKNEEILIDTKYYADYMAINYDVEKLKINNMYQMYAYLNNYNFNGKITGILLYPQPYGREKLEKKYTLRENKIMKFCTIDLSKDWKEIEKELLNLIEENNN